MDMSVRGGVILLHGHGQTGGAMRRIAAALRRAGYAIFAPSYGMRRPTAAILNRLAPQIDAFAAAQQGPLHSRGRCTSSPIR